VIFWADHELRFSTCIFERGGVGGGSGGEGGGGCCVIGQLRGGGTPLPTPHPPLPLLLGPHGLFQILRHPPSAPTPLSPPPPPPTLGNWTKFKSEPPSEWGGAAYGNGGCDMSTPISQEVCLPQGPAVAFRLALHLCVVYISQCCVGTHCICLQTPAWRIAMVRRVAPRKSVVIRNEGIRR